MSDLSYVWPEGKSVTYVQEVPFPRVTAPLRVHGMHVIVGTAMLAVGFGRLLAYGLTREHHAGLEAAILYWHFVDVVWLGLYLCVYGWTAA